jgi:dTDP-4-amino-4,6-dideoxy-D-galactose acyltransferase
MSDLCTLLSWDSDHWGFPVARLNSHHLTEDSAGEAIRWSERHKIRCLYFAADGTSAETLRAAWDNGFRFVDVRVDLEKTLSEPPDADEDGGSCRDALPEDLPAMERLARTAHEDTRFFKDAGFDRGKARDLYALWIARDLREHKVFASLSTGHPANLSGYVSVIASGHGEGRIGLVAVDAGARGGGLGGLLVRRALTWCRSSGAVSARVATQATNVAALRLYGNCGFKTADVKVWFHRWFGD